MDEQVTPDQHAGERETKLELLLELTRELERLLEPGRVLPVGSSGEML